MRRRWLFENIFRILTVIDGAVIFKDLRSMGLIIPLGDLLIFTFNHLFLRPTLALFHFLSFSFHFWAGIRWGYFDEIEKENLVLRYP